MGLEEESSKIIKDFTDYNVSNLENVYKVKIRAAELQKELAIKRSGLMSREEYYFVKYAAPALLIIVSLFALACGIDSFLVKEYIASVGFLLVSAISAASVYFVLSGKLSYVEIPKVFKAGEKK